VRGARLLDQRLDARLVAGVELDREPADFLGDRLGGRERPVCNDDCAGSLGGKTPDQRPPDASRATGDDDMPARNLDKGVLYVTDVTNDRRGERRVIARYACMGGASL
jgi:hypothetical protein